ncbi:MAG: hypothetical protein E7Y34_01445, partial [Mycoplasma sp.]|nr:hypothetical protein [Mycoplasma sp.]
MEQTFKKLIKKINFSPSNNFLSAKVIKAQIDKKDNCLNLNISNLNYLSLTEIKNFEEKLTESFGYDVNLHFQIENLAFKNELFLEYLNWFLVEKINYISLYHYISI